MGRGTRNETSKRFRDHPFKKNAKKTQQKATVVKKQLDDYLASGFHAHYIILLGT